MADRMPPVKYARDLRRERIAAFYAAADAAASMRIDFDDLAAKWMAARDRWLDTASRALPPSDLYPQIEAAGREQQALEALAAVQPNNAIRRIGKAARAFSRAVAESPVGMAFSWVAARLSRPVSRNAKSPPR